MSEELNKELGRWQTHIRNRVIQVSRAPDGLIDGGACESGDPLDFTLDEITQGINYVHNIIYDLLEWAKERKAAETADRPDENIHKKTLVYTWNQVIRRLEEVSR